MHEQLSAIQRTQVGRYRFTETDYAEELVVCRVGDRHGVRELLGRIDAITMTHGHVRICRCCWDLSRSSLRESYKDQHRQQRPRDASSLHLEASRIAYFIASISCCCVTMISCAMRRSRSLRP